MAFKKACLRLYHETQRLARDLERLSAFFFVARTGGDPESAPPGAPLPSPQLHSVYSKGVVGWSSGAAVPWKIVGRGPVERAIVPVYH